MKEFIQLLNDNIKKDFENLNLNMVLLKNIFNFCNELINIKNILLKRFL